MADEQNRCVVTFHKGVDTEQAVNELLDAGFELHNAKPESVSNFDFVMTMAQAEALKADPRVRDVRYGSKAENGIIPLPMVLDDSILMDKSGIVSNLYGQWGLAACSSTVAGQGTDIWSNSGTQASYQFPYSLSGKNVDIVIQDSGVDPLHPEFFDADGVTRYQTVDWPTISGQTQFTQDANYHRDLDGHGTHCAGISAGIKYGWAKNSKIYSLKILDDSQAAWGVSTSFNLLRNWHIRKTANPATGVIDPTVVNMSWGYATYYVNITGGQYRGANWAGTSPDQSKGMRTYAFSSDAGGYVHGVRVSSVDSDIEDCILAGIILVGAAGNYAHKIDVVGGADYNNYYIQNGFQAVYYNQGATPGATPGVICVGSVDSVYTSSRNRCATYSERGPRIDLWAPGTNVMSSVSGSKAGVAVNDPRDSNFKVRKLSGTSMASPQVCGVIGTLLETRPTATPAEALNWVTNKGSVNSQMYDATTGVVSSDYTITQALQGAPNKFLRTPYSSSTPYTIS